MDILCTGETVKLSSIHVTWFTQFSYYYYQHCDGFCGLFEDEGPHIPCTKSLLLHSPNDCDYILCLLSTIAISIFLYSGILKFFDTSFSTT